MVGFGNNKQALSAFQKNARRQIKRLKDTGEPEVLTVNGKPELVVQSAKAYKKMMADVEFARELRALRESVEQAKRGEGQDYREAFKEIAKEVNIEFEP
jgi:prevent-host-death family protein